MNKENIFKGKFIKKGNVYYFINVPPDIDPASGNDARDKNKWGYWRKENYRFFKKELEKFSDSSILVDIGAGRSNFFDLFERFNRYSVDFYPYQDINVICDINKFLPFKNDSIDIIILSNILEHTKEPNKLLEECFRILKPKGILLGAVPFLKDIHQRPYDFYRYTDINLYYLLQKNNFDDIDVIPTLSLYWLWFDITSRFFINLLEQTNFSSYALVQMLVKFFLRLVWKMLRTLLRLLKPLLIKCYPNQDLPLGFSFKAYKT